MSNTTKTIGYLAGAAALVAVALATVPDLGSPDLFNDAGELFFDKFTNPDEAAALEVVQWDKDTAVARPFLVQKKNGRWTIPSHHDYPADAKEQMAKAAGLFIGLKKATVRSDDPAEHKAFGVLDPNDAAADPDGRGTLVEFQDGAGNGIASLIVGNEVEGRQNQRYVRYPDKKRTYVAEIASVPDTRFATWIDTELMDAPSYEIEELVFDNYSIDENTGMREQGELIDAKKDNYKWTLDSLQPDEEVDETRLSEVASAVADLKIIGVRAKPEGLTRDLKSAEGIQLSQATVVNLLAHGFFVARDGNLYSNEGDLIVKTKKGVSYVMRFGEVLYGEGDDVSAGTEGEGKSDTTDKPADDANMKANRYLMITAHFDDKFLGKPADQPLAADILDQRKQAREQIQKVVDAINTWKSQHDGALPDSLAALTTGDQPVLPTLDKDPWGNDLVLDIDASGDAPKPVVKSLGIDGAPGGDRENADIASDAFASEDALQKTADDFKAYETKVEEGKKLAQKMTDRFAPWYYVIDDASFKKLRATRASLVKAKAADATDPLDDSGDTDDDDEG